MITTLLVLNLIGIIVISFILFKTKRVDNTESIIKKLEPYFEKSDKTLKDEMFLNRKEVNDSGSGQRRELQDSLKSSRDSLEGGMEKIRDVVEKKLESLQKNNKEELTAMRVIVDEKLQATLEKRLGDNFKLVKPERAFKSEFLPYSRIRRRCEFRSDCLSSWFY